MSLYLQIITALFWVLIGCFCSYTAKQKGRDHLIWFFLGLFFGIFGLIVLLILPSVKKEPLIETPTPAPVNTVKDKMWFYLDSDRNQFGPVTFEALAQAWKEDYINESSFVWTDGMENWVKIKDHAELSSALDI